jgi:hypothetical protein
LLAIAGFVGVGAIFKYLEWRGVLRPRQD